MMSDKTRIQPTYTPTSWEIEAAENNEALANALQRFLDEQEALQPPPRPTREEIATELRAAIQGRSLTSISSEARVLVINLQGCMVRTKKERSAWWRQRAAHHDKLARQLAKQKRALIEFEAKLQGIEVAIAERAAPTYAPWLALDRAEREAREQCNRAREEFRNGGDPQRSRAFLALAAHGLRPEEIVDLALATDGVDWHTGERTGERSAWLAEYLADHNRDFPAKTQQWHMDLSEIVRKDIERHAGMDPAGLPYDPRWAK